MSPNLAVSPTQLVVAGLEVVVRTAKTLDAPPTCLAPPRTSLLLPAALALACSAEAKAQNKLVFVDVGAYWCPPCHELDEKVLTEPEFAAWLEHRIIPVHVDALNDRYKGYDERKLIELRGEVRTVDGKDWVRLIVEDHGPGIVAAVLPRIFDPFFTTKGRDQGTGLGLAVSHGIAKDHGGS